MSEIYFILEGSVELYISFEKSQISKTMSEGYHFGDYNILFNRPFEFNVKATSNLKTYALPKHIFKDILEKEGNKNILDSIHESSGNLYRETCRSIVIFKFYFFVFLLKTKY